MITSEKKQATKLTTYALLAEKTDQALLLLTFGVVAGSFFLAALIISSFALAK